DLVLAPFDLFLMPIWLVMLVRRTVRRPLVLALLANLIVVIVLLFVLTDRFAVEGHEATALDIVLAVSLLLQSYGIYLVSLTYAFFGLGTPSVSAPRRDFRFVVLVLLTSTVVGYGAEIIDANGDSPASYNPRLELPIFALVGFGFIGYRQARRLLPATSGDPAGGDVVDETFFVEYGLSPREKDVALRLRAEGKTRDIAERLFVSEATINSHIRNIYRKCDVHSRVELVNLMRRYERLPTSAIGAR
ncbi:MAG: helix-turn-helix transcriptional regulator, partial [Spirochaetales bacterium]|nr:helix-turn-helix transcriptional regulator [Spirochaetales bacterium]